MKRNFPGLTAMASPCVHDRHRDYSSRSHGSVLATALAAAVALAALAGTLPAMAAPGPNKSRVVVTGEPTGEFTKSYESLKPFVKWYEWGGASIEPIITRPGRIGSDISPLTNIMFDDVHSQSVKLDDDELQRLYIWLDGNVPFYGTYESETRLAQKNGLSVPPPSLQ